MGNTVKCQCSIPASEQLTMHDITKNLQEYAITNSLFLYDAPTRELLQKLFVIGQSHIGDRLIQLHKAKNDSEKANMIADLRRIDLQQFDELCYLQKLFKNKGFSVKIDAKSKQKEQKTAQQYEFYGHESLKNEKFLLIVTLNRFDDDLITQQTDLTSRKSRLELFLDKLQALSCRYQADYEVVLIAREKQSKKLPSLLKSDNRIRVVVYSPFLPCISADKKIVLFGNRIVFNQNQGDMLYFLLKEPSLKDIANKFDYVNFCDIHNIASPAIDPVAVGWLATHPQYNVVACSKGKDQPLITDQFYKFQARPGDILIRAQLLTEISIKTSSLYQLLATRITQQPMPAHSGAFYLSRQIEDILYWNYTHVLALQHCASNRVQYSNYCKRVLGIVNESPQDIVEMCPSILHSGEGRVGEIRDSLRSSAEGYNYPIIVVRSGGKREPVQV